MKMSKTSYVYFILAEQLNLVKIGCSEDVTRRFKELQRMNADRLILLKKIKGNFTTERLLHDKFKNLKVHNEWFRFNDVFLDYLKNKI